MNESHECQQKCWGQEKKPRAAVSVNKELEYSMVSDVLTLTAHLRHMNICHGIPTARIPVINHQIPGLVCKSEQGHCLKRQEKGMKQACLWYELIWKPIHSFFLIYGLNIHRQSGRMRFWQFPISATHIYLRVTREKSSEIGLGEYEFLLSKDCESLHFWVTIAPSRWFFERDPMSGFGAL